MSRWYSTRGRPVADRFSEKAAPGGLAGDCLEWQAARDPEGYGHFQIDGRRCRAHRVSYELHIGPIPDGMVVRHKCDNPPCVNPAHLELGTPAENVKDCNDRGRQARGRHDGKRYFGAGASNPAAKLDATAVSTVRAMRAEGCTYKAIGHSLGVSAAQAHRIATGKSWGA